MKDGAKDWAISGIKDFDTQGRVIREYKVRYMSEVGAKGLGLPCPLTGEWCDPEFQDVSGTGEAGSALGVAMIQTAYDARSRVIRTSSVRAGRAARATLPILGQAEFRPVTPKPHRPSPLTRFEFPAPGATRIVNARRRAAGNTSPRPGARHQRGGISPRGADACTQPGDDDIRPSWVGPRPSPIRRTTSRRSTTMDLVESSPPTIPTSA